MGTRTDVLLVVLVAAIVLLPAAGASEVRISSYSPGVVNYSFTGNDTYAASVGGTLGLFPQPALQRFTKAALEICEQITTAAGGHVLGGGIVLGTTGGQRGLVFNLGFVGNGQHATYGNFCAGNYNDTASIFVKTDVYIVAPVGGGIQGSLFFGFANNVGNPCDPWMQLSLGATGTITKLGVGMRSQTVINYQQTVTPTLPLANRTWYTLSMWQNASQQGAMISYASGGARVLSLTTGFPSATTGCHAWSGGTTFNQGASVMANQTDPAGTAAQAAFTNMTIGTLASNNLYWGTRMGKVISPAITATQTVTNVTFHLRIQTNGTWLCPCWINATQGGTFWSSAAVTVTAANATQNVVVPVTLVTGGSLVLTAYWNAQDGLSDQYIDSITLSTVAPKVWTNPTDTNAAAQAASSWVGPFVLFILVTTMFWAIFEGYRRKFAD